MAMHASDPHICMHMMNETGRPVIGPCPTLCCPWRCAASQNETRRVSSLRCQTLQRMSLYLSQPEMTLDNIGERPSIDSLRFAYGFLSLFHVLGQPTKCPRREEPSFSASSSRSSMATSRAHDTSARVRCHQNMCNLTNHQL